MKHSLKKYISLFLCFCLFIQPFIFSSALYAETIFTDGSTVDDITSKLSNSASQVGGVQGSSIKTGSAGDDADQADIDKANQKTGEASANLNKINGTTGNINSQIQQVKQATAMNDNSDVNALTKITATIQKILIKVGETLISIGQLLKTVGQALQAIGAVLKAIPWTHAAGVALENVGKILYKVGTVVENVGKVIKSTGEAAAQADNAFGGFLGNITDAIKNGWKQGGEEADAYSNELNAKFSNLDTATSQQDSTVNNEDSNSENTSDVDQGDIIDM